MVIIYWLTFIITKEPLISYADQIHTDNTEKKKKKEYEQMIGWRFPQN